MTHRCAVCGREIEPGREAGRLEQEEHVYYLCSDDCYERFEEEPEAYDLQWGEEEDRRKVF